MGRAAMRLALLLLLHLPPVARAVCPADDFTLVRAVTARFRPNVAEVCAPCPQWSDTRGAVGVLNKSGCFCEHSSYNAAAQGAVQCRESGANLSTTAARMDNFTALHARAPARQVFWLNTDEPKAFQTIMSEQGGISIADALARIESGQWGAHLPLRMWWHGMIDDLERWDAPAAQAARLADSQWLPIQRLMPLLEAWAAEPTVCAVCEPAPCIDCCGLPSPARNCSDHLGVATPRPGWWRRNATQSILHRCPAGAAACLGGTLEAGHEGIDSCRDF